MTVENHMLCLEYSSTKIHGLIASWQCKEELAQVDYGKAAS